MKAFSRARRIYDSLLSGQIAAQNRADISDQALSYKRQVYPVSVAPTAPLCSMKPKHLSIQ